MTLADKMVALRSKSTGASKVLRSQAGKETALHFLAAAFLEQPSVSQCCMTHEQPSHQSRQKLPFSSKPIALHPSGPVDLVVVKKLFFGAGLWDRSVLLLEGNGPPPFLFSRTPRIESIAETSPFLLIFGDLQSTKMPVHPLVIVRWL